MLLKKHTAQAPRRRAVQNGFLRVSAVIFSGDAHWPLETGKDLPRRVLPKASDLVPIRVEIEPHVSMLLDPADRVPRRILETGAWEPDSWRAISEGPASR